MGNIYTYESKRDWAKRKMEEAVDKGNIEEAQKFSEIAAAYDYAAEQRLQQRAGW